MKTKCKFTNLLWNATAIWWKRLATNGDVARIKVIRPVVRVVANILTTVSGNFIFENSKNVSTQVRTMFYFTRRSNVKEFLP